MRSLRGSRIDRRHREARRSRRPGRRCPPTVFARDARLPPSWRDGPRRLSRSWQAARARGPDAGCSPRHGSGLRMVRSAACGRTAEEGVAPGQTGRRAPGLPRCTRREAPEAGRLRQEMNAIYAQRRTYRPRRHTALDPDPVGFGIQTERAQPGVHGGERLRGGHH